MTASPDLLGVLAVNKDEVPIEVSDGKRGDAILSKATDQPEVMPAPTRIQRSRLEFRP
jgi:hypothetical protein